MTTDRWRRIEALYHQMLPLPVHERAPALAAACRGDAALCGRRPFSGETTLASLASTLLSVPDPPRSLRKEIPESAGASFCGCLEKNPEARYDSARELHRDLVALRAAKTTRAHGVRAALIAVGLTGLAAAAVWGVLSFVHMSRIRWVERKALPEITRLINENRRLAALKLFRQADSSYAPASPALVALAEGVVAPAATGATCSVAPGTSRNTCSVASTPDRPSPANPRLDSAWSGA